MPILRIVSFVSDSERDWDSGAVGEGALHPTCDDRKNPNIYISYRYMYLGNNFHDTSYQTVRPGFSRHIPTNERISLT